MVEPRARAASTILRIFFGEPGRFKGACTGMLDSTSRELSMSLYSALSLFFAVFERFIMMSFGVLDPMWLNFGLAYSFVPRDLLLLGAFVIPL